MSRLIITRPTSPHGISRSGHWIFMIAGLALVGLLLTQVAEKAALEIRDQVAGASAQ